MSYSNKHLFVKTFPEHDFGAGAEIYSFRLPLNEHGVAMKGRLVNAGVHITETFANDQGGGTLQIGTAADNDAYALVNIADGAADEDCYDVTDDTDAILEEDIAAGTLIEVNCTQSTDSSTAAGKGMPFVEIYCW